MVGTARRRQPTREGRHERSPRESGAHARRRVGSRRVKTLRRKLLRDVKRSRANFVAVTVTVFLGVTLFAAAYDSFQNLEASYAQTAIDFRFANLTVHGGETATFAAAATTEGAESVQQRIVADVPLAVSGSKLLGRVVGMPAAGQPAVNQVKVLTGAYLDPSRPEGVLVEEHMADHFNLATGAEFEVLAPQGWRTVQVVGVVSSPEYIWPARNRQDIITSPDDFGVVFAGETLAREVTGLAEANEAAVYYVGGEEDPALSDRLTTLAAEAGALDVYTRAEQASNAALEEDLRGFEELSLFFPVLFLVAAAMAAYVMINRLVHSQRPLIGILFAEGFTRRQVVGHYLGYGLLPGLAGAIPGAIAGVLLARMITGLYTDIISVPVRLIQFYPATLLQGALFGVLATLIAAAAPALFASRVMPAQAMRGTIPTRKGRPSVAERLLPPLRRLPIRWRMTLRGIERNPRRTVYTVVGVVLSLTLILVSWGMIDTTRFLLDRQFVEIQRNDATVHFTGLVGSSEVAALESISGVAAAEPVLELPVSISQGELRYETVLVAMEPATEMHRFVSGSGTIELPGEGILAGIALRDQLEVAEGDLVTVGAAGFSVQERIAGFVDEPLGTVAYISRDRVAALAGGGELPATAALLRYEEGAVPEELRATLTARDDVTAFEDSKAIYRTVQDYMSLFYGFVGIMLVFGSAMAFALVFNAMTVNIAERSREAATLLAVGVERRTLTRLITAENLLVVGAGIPLGLVLGWYVSSLAMASFNSDLFRFDLYVRPTTFLWSALAILSVALLSQAPGLRAVRRLDVARIVKERSL